MGDMSRPCFTEVRSTRVLRHFISPNILRHTRLK